MSRQSLATLVQRWVRKQSCPIAGDNGNIENLLGFDISHRYCLFRFYRPSSRESDEVVVVVRTRIIMLDSQFWILLIIVHVYQIYDYDKNAQACSQALPNPMLLLLLQGVVVAVILAFVCRDDFIDFHQVTTYLFYYLACILHYTSLLQLLFSGAVATQTTIPKILFLKKKSLIQQFPRLIIW